MDLQAQRRVVAEELAGEGLAQQADQSAVADVAPGEGLALLDVGPVAEFDIARSAAR